MNCNTLGRNCTPPGTDRLSPGHELEGFRNEYELRLPAAIARTRFLMVFLHHETVVEIWNCITCQIQLHGA